MSGLRESHVSTENNPIGGFVEATLNYFAEASEKPVIYTYEPSPGTPRMTGKSEAHSVLIRDGRLADELSLDRQGFQLVHQETVVRDFYDRAEVEKIYYPEIEVLLKEATGAEKVVVFDHQVRNIELSKQGEKDAREYVRTVHNDYTAKSGPRRVRDHLPEAEAEERLRHRFASRNSMSGGRFVDRSNPRRWRYVTRNRSTPRTLFRPISFTATKSARSIGSPTTRNTGGLISRVSSATRSFF